MIFQDMWLYCEGFLGGGGLSLVDKKLRCEHYMVAVDSTHLAFIATIV